MITNIGKKLKQLRELQGFSQEYMATQLGISTRAYSKIEAEETKLTIDRLNEISEIIGISPQEILGFDSNIIFNNSTRIIVRVIKKVSLLLTTIRQSNKFKLYMKGY